MGNAYDAVSSFIWILFKLYKKVNLSRGRYWPFLNYVQEQEYVK